MASYLAPGGEARAEIREKGSRFLAVAGPAADEAAARDLLAGLERELPGATHYCWAWRLGEPARERSADAGEPAGTAGMPILQTGIEIEGPFEPKGLSMNDTRAKIFVCQPRNDAEQRPCAERTDRLPRPGAGAGSV